MLTAEFITQVRRQARLTPEISDTDILSAGDLEVQATFLPMLREAGAEYGLRRWTVTIANGRARIPDRAQVAGVRLVQLIQGTVLSPLPQMQPEDDIGSAIAGPTPYGWYFDAGDICVLPSSASGQLLIRYYQRPSSMILSSSATQTSVISGVNENPDPIDVNFGGTTVVSGGDIVSAASDHRIVVPGLVNGTATASISLASLRKYDLDVHVDAGPPTTRSISQGDWVAPNGRTPFVPLPEELSASLVYRTAAVFQTSLGYLEEAQAAFDLSDSAAARAMRLLTPRADGNPLVVTASISRSLAQGRGVGWGRW